jgi:hypothetical protein
MKKIALFEIVYNLTHRERLREMACIALIKSNPRTLPDGMRLDVITKEYKGTGEEPHFHLFPANHTARDGKANNYDLITRVALPNNPPKTPNEVRAIQGNKPIPKEYQNAIYNWARERYKNLEISNWVFSRSVWDAQAAAIHTGQL